MKRPSELVSWYCHSCGRTHVHTPAQRDSHRDALMAAFAASIDARAEKGSS
jgi:hypothetical protein